MSKRKHRKKNIDRKNTDVKKSENLCRSNFDRRKIHFNIGAQRRPKSNSADAIQKRTNVLNEHYSNKAISIDDSLNGLSLIVAKQKNEFCFNLLSLNFVIDFFS